MTPPLPSFARSMRFASALAAALIGPIPVSLAADSGSPLQSVGLFGVTGSGKLQTEARAVGSFQAIELHASMDLVLRQGAREAVEVRADDNLLALIETRVVSRAGVPTLEIGTKDHTQYSSSNPITVTIDVVTLRALSVRGSGNVTGDGLKVPGLKINLAGSGNVKLQRLSLDEASVKISGSGNADLTGKAARLGLSIAGSGDVDTRELEADDVSISVAGSGGASVNARKTLVVSIAGSGSVDYVGDAAVKTSIAGSGRVKKH